MFWYVAIYMKNWLFLCLWVYSCCWVLFIEDYWTGFIFAVNMSFVYVNTLGVMKLFRAERTTHRGIYMGDQISLRLTCVWLIWCFCHIWRLDLVNLPPKQLSNYFSCSSRMVGEWWEFRIFVESAVKIQSQLYS